VVDTLFTRPADDSAAAQIAPWGQALIQRIGSRTHTDLAGSAAMRGTVDVELASGVQSVFHFGHGTEDSLLGHGGAIVDAANVHIVPKMVVAIACESAVNLGPLAVSSGVRAYLGFDDILGVPSKAPLPMGRAVSGGLDCLFTMNHEIGCATSQVQRGIEEARVEYIHNGPAYGLSDSEVRLARVFMKHNFHSLRLLGDATTTT
jgi:hypothetical protein